MLFFSKVFGSRYTKFFLKGTCGWKKGHRSSGKHHRPRKTEKQKRRNPAALAQRSQVLQAFKMQDGSTRAPTFPLLPLNTCKKSKCICIKLIPRETSSLERRFPTVPWKLVPTCQSQQSKASRGGRHPSLLPLLWAGASEEHQHHHTCSSEAEGRRRCEGEPNSGLAGAAPLGMDLMSSVSK